MSFSSFNLKRYFPWIFLALCILLVALVVVAFFEQVPVANGWAIDWNAFSNAIRNGDIRYSPADGLRPPPWSVLPLLPLGFVSMRAGWGLLTLFTLIILIVSVPAGSRQKIGIILLTVSFPTLRVLVDGNFEGWIIAGVLLLLHGYKRCKPVILVVGVLIATIKPQAVFLLLLVLALYVLQTWSLQLWLKSLAVLLLVVIPCLIWRGEAWLVAMFGENFNNYTASLIDVTLLAALQRAGITAVPIRAGVWLLVLGITLFITLTGQRELTREKAGLLIAASLLTAPYAAGNSLLVPLAIGVIPLFMRHPALGGLFVALFNLPLVFYQMDSVSWLAYYFTFSLLLLWGVLLWQEYQSRRQLSPQLIAQ